MPTANHCELGQTRRILFFNAVCNVYEIRLLYIQCLIGVRLLFLFNQIWIILWTLAEMFEIVKCMYDMIMWMYINNNLLTKRPHILKRLTKIKLRHILIFVKLLQTRELIIVLVVSVRLVNQGIDLEEW
jgi:hypothetical protein